MTHPKITLEVCAESVEGAMTAQAAGASRIELCAALSEGGLTPSPALIEAARRALSIKLYVLVRPRGGDFFYSNMDFDIMRADVHFCGKAGADGVVIGALNPDATIDQQRCQSLVDIAKSYGMGVTFHRAFDRAADLYAAMETIIAMGCERILTSGGCPTAQEGASVIGALIRQAQGRISIMAGAGITAENALSIAQATAAAEIHGSFRTLRPSPMLWRSPHFAQEYSLMQTDGDQIKAIFSKQS